MVLGLRSKNRKGVSVPVNYLVHVQEIKPWPPSQSLKSLQSLLLQWENGDQSSGSFQRAVPSGHGNVEFNESFKLPITLCRETSGRGKTRESFQKNCLEFNLYEPRREKSAKGQLLGTAVINLADYGIIKETKSINSPLNFKKSYRITTQIVLLVTIEPLEKDSASSSSMGSLSLEASVDKDARDSATELMNEEYDEDEIAAFTDDDDVSSHSSRAISSSAYEATLGSPSQTKENGSELAKDVIGRGTDGPTLPVKPAKPEVDAKAEALAHFNEPSPPLLPTGTSSKETQENSYASWSKCPERSLILIPKDSLTLRVQSSSLSTGLSSDMEIQDISHSSLSKRPMRSLTSVPKDSIAHHVQSSSSTLANQGTNKAPVDHEPLPHNFYENATDSKRQENSHQSIEDIIVASSFPEIKVGPNSENEIDKVDVEKTLRRGEVEKEAAKTINDLNVNIFEDKDRKELQENGSINKFSEDVRRKSIKLSSNSLAASKRELLVSGSLINIEVDDEKPVQLPFVSAKIPRSRAKEVTFVEDPHKDAIRVADSEVNATKNDFSEKKIARIDATHVETSKEETTKSVFSSSDNKLESRVDMLEEELREAAAVEVGLYSVVAEHGSSVNKVHAPARRLSRFFVHACRAKSRSGRASAARAAVSGLVLVSKACGNDVPRLTFWLSNSIVLRAIVSQVVGDELSSNVEDKNISLEGSDDWEDPQTFTIALENFEAWIFSRIVESVWWQTLTPHMQSVAARSSSKKSYGRRNSLADQEQGNFSIDLWKKAFKDACERLCPTRAGGHECGCLHLLSRLVMEQLVSRLDVAMFNAILRESDDEMPTDPVSDPISDSKVLPIPAGKSSFGAGAQLKNAIGNWSRWLTDLFGIDDNDADEETTELDNNKRQETETTFKPFHLLNALSDLMMLPKEILADKSTRKEVCPVFGAPVIMRVLDGFVPDEFCPDPIPDEIFEALDSEEALEEDGGCITTFPYMATPTVYSPPLATSLAGIIGEIGNQTLMKSTSSVLKKSYTSDDELDEVDSPFTSIFENPQFSSPTAARSSWTPKGKGGRNVVRYQLLRQVWKDCV